MQQTYCTVQEAQFDNVAEAVTLSDVIAASAVIQEHRGYPLIEPATQRRIVPNRTGRAPVVLPRPLTDVDTVELDDGGDQADDASFVETVLRIDGEVVYAGSANIRGDWGDGRRGTSITAPAELTADARTVANPSPAPDWWRAGTMLVWDDEPIRIDDVDADTTSLTRGGSASAHSASATVYQVHVPEALRRGCAAVARRVSWSVSTVEARTSRDDRGSSEPLDLLAGLGPLLDP